MNRNTVRLVSVSALCWLLAGACACDFLTAKRLTTADILASLRDAGYEVGVPEADSFFHEQTSDGIRVKVNGHHVKIFGFDDHDAARRAKVELEAEIGVALMNPGDVLLGPSRGMASAPGPEWHLHLMENVLVIVIAKDRTVADAIFRSLAETG